MVDFGSMLKRPAGEARQMPALIPGNYEGIVKSWEIVKAPPEKEYKEIVRFHVGLIGWPTDASEADKVWVINDAGETATIDLSKKQLRRDFYDNNLVFLDNFLRSCGVEPKGKIYEEVIPEVVGARIVVAVQQYLNQRTSQIGNQVGDIVGQS